MLQFPEIPKSLQATFELIRWVETYRNMLIKHHNNITFVMTEVEYEKLIDEFTVWSANYVRSTPLQIKANVNKKYSDFCVNFLDGDRKGIREEIKRIAAFLTEDPIFYPALKTEFDRVLPVQLAILNQIFPHQKEATKAVDASNIQSVLERDFTPPNLDKRMDPSQLSQAPLTRLYQGELLDYDQMTAQDYNLEVLIALINTAETAFPCLTRTLLTGSPRDAAILKRELTEQRQNAHEKPVIFVSHWPDNTNEMYFCGVIYQNKLLLMHPRGIDYLQQANHFIPDEIKHIIRIKEPVLHTDDDRSDGLVTLHTVLHWIHAANTLTRYLNRVKDDALEISIDCNLTRKKRTIIPVGHPTLISLAHLSKHPQLTEAYKTQINEIQHIIMREIQEASRDERAGPVIKEYLESDAQTERWVKSLTIKPSDTLEPAFLDMIASEKNAEQTTKATDNEASIVDFLAFLDTENKKASEVDPQAILNALKQELDDDWENIIQAYTNPENTPEYDWQFKPPASSLSEEELIKAVHEHRAELTNLKQVEFQLNQQIKRALEQQKTRQDAVTQTESPKTKSPKSKTRPFSAVLHKRSHSTPALNNGAEFFVRSLQDRLADSQKTRHTKKLKLIQLERLISYPHQLVRQTFDNPWFSRIGNTLYFLKRQVKPGDPVNLQYIHQLNRVFNKVPLCVPNSLLPLWLTMCKKIRDDKSTITLPEHQTLIDQVKQLSLHIGEKIAWMETAHASKQKTDEKSIGKCLAALEETEKKLKKIQDVLNKMQMNSMPTPNITNFAQIYEEFLTLQQTLTELYTQINVLEEALQTEQSNFIPDKNQPINKRLQQLHHNLGCSLAELDAEAAQIAGLKLENEVAHSVDSRINAYSNGQLTVIQSDYFAGGNGLSVRLFDRNRNTSVLARTLSIDTRSIDFLPEDSDTPITVHTIAAMQAYKQITAESKIPLAVERYGAKAFSKGANNVRHGGDNEEILVIEWVEDLKNRALFLPVDKKFNWLHDFCDAKLTDPCQPDYFRHSLSANGRVIFEQLLGEYHYNPNPGDENFQTLRLTHKTQINQLIFIESLSTIIQIIKKARPIVEGDYPIGISDWKPDNFIQTNDGIMMGDIKTLTGLWHKPLHEIKFAQLSRICLRTDAFGSLKDPNATFFNEMTQCLLVTYYALLMNKWPEQRDVFNDGYVDFCKLMQALKTNFDVYEDPLNGIPHTFHNLLAVCLRYGFLEESEIRQNLSHMDEDHQTGLISHWQSRKGGQNDWAFLQKIFTEDEGILYAVWESARPQSVDTIQPEQMPLLDAIDNIHPQLGLH